MGLPGDAFGNPLEKDASNDVPNIDAIPPNVGPHTAGDTVVALEAAALGPDVFIDAAALGSQGSEYPLVSTQSQTESQSSSYKPELDDVLVGCLIPATENSPRFDLFKTKKNRSWKLGRHPTNDLVIPGLKFSNFHCGLRWNGSKGKNSEVVLTDSSFNGTWVNDRRLPRGQKTILGSGAVISLGGRAHGPNVWRCIFRDIEGQSTRHMSQLWAKYDIGYELGVGAFARVHKCMERATGDEYAVKIIDKDKVHPSEQAVGREISILTQLAEFRHENVVTLREHFEENDKIYLILELVKGGDLLTYLASHGSIPEHEVRRMAAQICHAVAYIHSHGITHRDLKPENVLLTTTDPPNCMVADFGLAKLVNDHTFLKTICGTPAYLAPEIILGNDPHQGYDNRVDSWSLGIIFYRMLTNHSPFYQTFDPKATNSERSRYFISRKINWQRLNDSKLTEACCEFLRDLLAEKPENRKEVLHMLDHRWISSLLPADREFQHPPLVSSPSASPHNTSGMLTFTQSLESWHLSEMSIPGLNTLRTHTTAAPDAGQLGGGSFASEMSVEAKIPAVLPKPQTDEARQPLSRLERAIVENSSYELVVPGFPSNETSAMASRSVDETGPSRRMPSPAKVSAKRKRNPIEDCSSLSSLSSLCSASEDEVIKECADNPPVVPPRNKGKAIEAPTHKRARRS